MARADPSRDAAAADPRAAPPGTVPSPRAPAVPLDQTFDHDLLYVLRSAVAAHAAALGADEDTTFRAVIIAGELAANAIRHGGGHGRLRLWANDGYLHCEVSDEGPGIPDAAGTGTRQPPPGALGGRGIWIVRQLADRVVISGGPGGATVTATVPIGHRRGAAPA
jgi:anti-sigma regulatory factor (Ser/Thr protein kinase)